MSDFCVFGKKLIILMHHLAVKIETRLNKAGVVGSRVIKVVHSVDGMEIMIDL